MYQSFSHEIFYVRLYKYPPWELFKSFTQDEFKRICKNTQTILFKLKQVFLMITPRKYKSWLIRKFLYLQWRNVRWSLPQAPPWLERHILKCYVQRCRGEPDLEFKGLSIYLSIYQRGAWPRVWGSAEAAAHQGQVFPGVTHDCPGPRASQGTQQSHLAAARGTNIFRS